MNDTSQVRKSTVSANRRQSPEEDADEDAPDDIDSEDEGRGVPCTKQSDIRDAIESNLSRANQFSTHKSMSIRETEENVSNMKSVRRIETEVDKHSPNTQLNNTISQQMLQNITESPYKDPADHDSSALKPKEDVPSPVP